MRKVSLKDLPASTLAQYQTKQVGNDCALHAIASAIDLLAGKKFRPDYLIKEIDALWWKGRFYRVLPGWAVTPRMQARIVRYLSKRFHLGLDARYLHTSPEILRNLPFDPDVAALVTLYWPARQVPPIYKGETLLNFNGTQKMGGHTMLFAMFDPSHQSGGKLSTPWGFINSWSDGGNDLYWMEDQIFRRAWAAPIPLIGNHATVLISRQAQ